MMAERIVFLDKGIVELESFEPSHLAPGEVRLKTRKSLISTGTEGICLHRLFEPQTHWDEWVKYPFRSGYCTVADVAEVGNQVTDFKVGQRVVTRIAHCSEAVVPAAMVYPVPDQIPDEDAAWFALGMIGFMGAKAGAFSLGQSIAIVGAGPIGQMALRWAAAAGASRVAVVDPVDVRLDHARNGGATDTFLSRADGARTRLLDQLGELPHTVVDTTGHAAVFQECLRLPRDRGLVVLLGDSGTPSEQRLTLDVVRRGIGIRGAHITHETADWTERTVYALFFDLVARGRFSLQGLNTHVFRPDRCKDAYALTTDRRDETMGVLFDWSS